jgi:hypothetical protein
MQHDEVHKGLLVRLLADYSNIPSGTCAMVDSTGTMEDGTWWFAVRWRPYTPIPQKFPRQMTEYSLNLWERDLALFEVVSAEEAAGKWKPESGPSIIPPLPQLSGGRKARRQGGIHPNQLSLFLADDF